ncbi:MAG: SCO family protein [Spirochaetes bacterium]|nr:MAG: SCO family protein [Spirochaetota bacterium]
MRSTWSIILPLFMAAVLCGPLYGHEDHEGAGISPGMQEKRSGVVGDTGGAPADRKDVGMDEKLGAKIPGEAVFLDENGRKLTLASYLDKPTLVLPLYYTCPQTCGLMLGHLATALGDVPLVPGRDFRVLALSIDEQDDPASATRAKTNYFKLVRKEFPEGDWRFLTGDAANIRAFTDAIGFRFKKTGTRDFIHPNVLIVLAHDGTVIRYLYGPTFLPFDIGMAITEAEKGTPSLSVRKLVSLCFQYEPENGTYKFSAIRIVITVMLAFLAIIMYLLLRKNSARRPAA